MTSYPIPRTRRSTRNKPLILEVWGDAMLAYLTAVRTISRDAWPAQKARRQADAHMDRFRRYADALRRLT